MSSVMGDPSGKTGSRRKDRVFVRDRIHCLLRRHRIVTARAGVRPRGSPRESSTRCLPPRLRSRRPYSLPRNSAQQNSGHTPSCSLRFDCRRWSRHRATSFLLRFSCFDTPTLNASPPCVVFLWRLGVTAGLAAVLIPLTALAVSRETVQIQLLLATAVATAAIWPIQDHARRVFYLAREPGSRPCYLLP